jgi:DNA invertase Pin-like site-specific DNA recombinase
VVLNSLCAIFTRLLVQYRELKSERASAGRASAKARGRSGGRPRTDITKLQNARVLYENSDKTASEICQTIGIGRRAFFAYMAEMKKLNSQQNNISENSAVIL